MTRLLTAKESRQGRRVIEKYCYWKVFAHRGDAMFFKGRK